MRFFVGWTSDYDGSDLNTLLLMARLIVVDAASFFGVIGSSVVCGCDIPKP